MTILINGGCNHGKMTQFGCASTHCKACSCVNIFIGPNHSSEFLLLGYSAVLFHNLLQLKNQIIVYTKPLHQSCLVAKVPKHSVHQETAGGGKKGVMYPPPPPTTTSH